MHLWKKLLATTALTVALLGLAPAGMASASPNSQPATSVATQYPAALLSTADSDKNSWKDIGCGSADNSNCLPYKRWMPATQAFHGRFDGFGGMAATSYQVQAGVSSSLMSTGNLLYSLGGSIVGLADNVNILQVAGKDVNKGFAAIGSAFRRRHHDGPDARAKHRATAHQHHHRPWAHGRHGDGRKRRDEQGKRRERRRVRLRQLVRSHVASMDGESHLDGDMRGHPRHRFLVEHRG
jgi:hypothetical protein